MRAGVWALWGERGRALAGAVWCRREAQRRMREVDGDGHGGSEESGGHDGRSRAGGGRVGGGRGGGEGGEGGIAGVLGGAIAGGDGAGEGDAGRGDTEEAWGRGSGLPGAGAVGGRRR